MASDTNTSSMRPLPPTPASVKGKDESVNETKSIGKGAKPSRDSDDGLLIFALRWVCIVLTVAASIVFGIWAPLSYKATVDANNDGNVAQGQAIRAADAANSLASSQSSVLADVQTRMAAMGQLQFYDFCVGKKTLSACSIYLATVDFNSMARAITATVSGSATMISAIGSTTATMQSEINGGPSYSTSFATSAPSVVASGERPGHGSGIALAAVMGIVFGIVGLVGLVAGVFMWRYRQRRLGQQYSSVS